MRLIFPWILLVLLSGVEGQDKTNYQCGENPIKILLSKIISESSVHSTISLISDQDFQNVDTVFTNPEHKYFSKAIKKLNVDTFQQDLLYIADDTVHSHHVIILPNTTDTAITILNKIGLVEKGNPFSRKIQNYIIWPTDCLTSADCFKIQIDQMSFDNLPSISSECYIIQCGLSALTGQGSWNLHNIYSVGREKLTRLNPVSWDDVHNSSYATKVNFKSATVQATIPTKEKLLDQELLYVISENGTVIIKDGLDYDVISFLQESLHFKLNYSFSSIWFGYNGTEWVGLARQLLDEEADICLVKVTALPFRRDQFTFLMPHFVEGIQAFFRQPPASSIRNIFFQPFTKNLWATLIVVWLLVGLSNVVTAKIKSIYEQLPPQDEQISKDSILLSIAFTCQQGWFMDPQSISMKIVFFCGSVMGLIIYVAYSAALVSTLSTTVVPIKKFANILQNEFSITYEPHSSSLETLLNGSAQQGYGEDEFDVHQVNLVRSKAIKTSTTEESIRLVLQSNAAFLGFSDVFYSIATGEWKQTERNLCEQISYVRFSKVPFRSGMVVKRNSPLKEFFNYKLIVLYEYGLMRRIQRDYVMSFRGECDKQRQKKGQGLGTNDLFTAYVIIVSGHALSFTIFLIEIFYFKRFNAQQLVTKNSGKANIFVPTKPDNYIF